MLEALQSDLLSAVLAGFVALLTFLVRSFFQQFTREIKELKSSVDAFSGELKTVREDARENTTQIAVTRQELKAVWRFIDHHKRASDLNGGDHD